MQYQESYQGQHIAVTTEQGPSGEWNYQTQLLEGGNARFLAAGESEGYPSEEQARRAGFSAAAAAIDRGRSGRGKP